MASVIHKIEKKVNGMVFSLIGWGIFFVALAMLIVWTDFVLRILVGLFVLGVAYTFFYTAFKLRAIKKELKHILDI